MPANKNTIIEGLLYFSIIFPTIFIPVMLDNMLITNIIEAYCMSSMLPRKNCKVVEELVNKTIKLDEAAVDWGDTPMSSINGEMMTPPPNPNIPLPIPPRKAIEE